MYELLSSPGKIGRLTIPNRVVMTAMGTFTAAPGGGVNDDIIAFYETRAKGGVGLIITEVTRVTDGAGGRRTVPVSGPQCRGRSGTDAA